MLALELPLISGHMDSDTALIHDCLAGNAAAFGSLIARHRDGVYNFVRHTVGSNADAQDLAQEAFVHAYAALRRFRSGAPFEPWLYTIAANLCRSYLRQAYRCPEFSDVDGVIENLPAPSTADPAIAVEQRDEHRRLLVAIHALPAEQRMVVILRHLQDRSYREIATILEIPISTVEHRLRSARHALWDQLHMTAAAPQGGVGDGLR